MKRPSAVIQLSTGRFVDVLDVRPEDIPSLEELSISLTNQCRFNGHSSRFYPVSEHCLLVAQILLAWRASKREVAWGLLHDVAEVFFGEITSPLKRTLGCARQAGARGEALKTYELRALKVFGFAFELSPELPPHVVHEADLMALAIERRDLMPRGRDPNQHWRLLPKPIEDISVAASFAGFGPVAGWWVDATRGALNAAGAAKT